MESKYGHYLQKSTKSHPRISRCKKNKLKWLSLDDIFGSKSPLSSLALLVEIFGHPERFFLFISNEYVWISFHLLCLVIQLKLCSF